MEDELGKSIELLLDDLETLGWDQLLAKQRGRGDLKLQPLVRSHPAYQLLSRLQATGAPAISTTPPWSSRKLNRRIRRGSHQSCRSHLSFLREELLDFTQKGFWLVLPWRVVRQLQKLGHLLGLKVSPLGVVPQRDRRPRLIVDLSFYDINLDTLLLAPKEALQFGRALERILYQVRHSNPRFGPVYLSKTDLSDGFYRVGLNKSAMAQLAVALPQFPDEEQLLAIPLVLPMGWAESPAYFCATTETIADLVNRWPANIKPAAHPMYQLSQTQPEPAALAVPSLPRQAPALQPLMPLLPSTPASISEPPKPSLPREPPVPSLPRPVPSLPQSAGVPCSGDALPTTEQLSSPAPPVLLPFTKPVRHTDVFMDDFLQLIQGPPGTRRDHVLRLLHMIDAVYRPLDAQDSPLRKAVASRKKYLQGDGCLRPRKTILGWIIDALRQTLELPPHRIERLQQIFDDLRHRSRVSTKKWHRYLGELRHMSLGIPGSKGLFSLLQEGLCHTDQYRLKITPAMRDQLTDFEHLAHSLKSRPTELAEIVPDHPVAVGPHDAAGDGAGGAWLPATTHSNIPPLLWRFPFPQWVRDNLVSFSNPHGTITNSDLELLGGIAHQDVLAQHVNLRGRTVAPLSDNTPQISWTHKKSTTTTGPAAYLLRLSSILQRHSRFNSYSSFLPGDANGMADDPSRMWKLSDSQLLAHFNSTYPQDQPWQLVHPRPALISCLLSALLKQRPGLEMLLTPPPTKTACGPSGKPLWPLLDLTPTSTPLNPTSSYLFSKFSPRKSATEPTPAATLSKLNEYRTTYAPSQRRFAWGPNGEPIPAMVPSYPSTSNSASSTKPTKRGTPLPARSSRYRDNWPTMPSNTFPRRHKVKPLPTP